MTWSNLPIPDTIAIPLAVGIAIEMFFSTRVFNPSSWAVAIAILILTISLSLIFWSMRVLGHHLINAPDVVITAGPFARSRNPNYVAWFLIVMSGFCFTGSVWIILSLAVALPLTHYAAILPEESFLEDRFGEPYLEYSKKVRRYL